MHDANDDDATAVHIERALEESQRQERAELHAELARQVEADQRVVDALAKKQDD